MNNPLISVIVPVYGVEQYLDRCVESIVNQAYRNLEIILVDDGSPDNCPAMCNGWAEKDSRIKVIHKKNGGLSDARNAGMAVASGELMGFVDSDDWIAPEMYQMLYENMVETSSDISCCGVEMVWEDGTPSRMLTVLGDRVLNREDAMEAILKESWLKHPVWYKLYKADLIRDIPFPEGKYHEDVFWSYQAVGRVGKVSVFDTPCYHYAQRDGSIMGSDYSLKRLDGLEAEAELVRYVTEHFLALAREARLQLLFSCLYHRQQALRFLEAGEQKKAAEIIDTIRLGNPVQSGDCKDLSLKRRAWVILSGINFETTCKLRNQFQIGL